MKKKTTYKKTRSKKKKTKRKMIMQEERPHDQNQDESQHNNKRVCKQCIGTKQAWHTNQVCQDTYTISPIRPNLGVCPQKISKHIYYLKT